MCCTSRPALLSSTLIYVGEATREGKLVHVLAYQNSAESLHKGTNSMILPFPASAEMGPDNVIDTRDFKGFLKDITDASKIPTRSITKGTRRSRKLGHDSVKIFDIGSYTVLLANDPRAIRAALASVPEEKRPEISDDFLAGYAELYPEHQVAVCCWNDKVKAEPLLWWYEPKDSEYLFVPTMDAHSGNAPVRDHFIRTDHIVSVGSAVKPTGNEVSYPRSKASIPDEVAALLPQRAYGARLPILMNNGDGFVGIATLHHGAPILVRRFGSGDPNAKVHLNGWDD